MLELLLVQIVGILLLTAIIISPVILIKLRVFSPVSLREAPQRPNRLNLIDLLAALFVVFATCSIFIAVTMQVDLSSSLVDVATALFIILVFRHRFADGLHGLGIWGPGKLRAVGFGVLLYVGIMPWLIVVEALSATVQKQLLHEKNQMHPVLKQLESIHSPEQILSLVVMICIIAPIAEELFFRGLLQTVIIGTIAKLRRGDANAENVRVGERLTGILVAAGIFAAVHLSVTKDAWSWLPALFLLGVALGYAYERTGRLWADITIHALFNAFAVTLVVFGHVGAPAGAHATKHAPSDQLTPKLKMPDRPNHLTWQRSSGVRQ